MPGDGRSKQNEANRSPLVTEVSPERRSGGSEAARMGVQRGEITENKIQKESVALFVFVYVSDCYFWWWF